MRALCTAIASVILTTALCAEPGTGTATRVPPSRDLDQFVATETGLITLSADGLGMLTTFGSLRVEKPSLGATVRVAWLVAASTGFRAYEIPSGGILLNGVPVVWDHSIPNGISSWNHLADVTTIVAPLLDPQLPGVLSVPVEELQTLLVDGTALYVIFDDPGTTEARTAVLAFGAQATGGDSFSIGFGQPVFPDSNTVVELGLGISYGYARSTCQTSHVTVNGIRLTSSAGGDDDGEDQNGALMTVGGVGDSRLNPPSSQFNDPCALVDFTDYDDELYNIASYIAPGSTSLFVQTFNPSADDNIFAATLLLDFAAVVGEGALLTPAHSASCIGDTQTLTLTLQDGAGLPISATAASIEVISGPNAGLRLDGLTDGLGQLALSYSGAVVGTDVISGSFTNGAGVLQTSNIADLRWQDCLNGEEAELSPHQAVTCLDSTHTVVLSVTSNSGLPLVGVPSSILVISGPSVGLRVDGVTDSSGQLSLSWTSSQPGTDRIRGSFLNSSGLQEFTSIAENDWQQCVFNDRGILGPQMASPCAGDGHTVTLRLEDGQGNPLINHPATIEVISGPNAGTSSSGLTDPLGNLSMSWPGSVAGLDLIQGSFIDSHGNPAQSNTVGCDWQPCVAGINGVLSPANGEHCPGESHTVTLTLFSGAGEPVPGYQAAIRIVSGPNAGQLLVDVTDANGQISMSYISQLIGRDNFAGSFLDEFGQTAESTEAQVDWLDCSLPAPVIQIENAGPCDMRLVWDRVDAASEYRIWSRTSPDLPWTLEGTTDRRRFDLDCIDTTPLKLYMVTSVAP
ncbi:MAG: hypothetical protein KDC10_08870 [Calditrichaeota bacterium]|nr:hypothetical protein [Calditrichota bacterium]